MPKRISGTSRALDGHTYVLEYGAAKVLKIGKAVYYAERLAQLRNMSPIEPNVVCVLEGLAHERIMHKRFAHLRVRGEFFQDVAEIREYVASHPRAVSHEHAVSTCNYTQSRKRLLP